MRLIRQYLLHIRSFVLGHNDESTTCQARSRGDDSVRKPTQETPETPSNAGSSGSDNEVVPASQQMHCAGELVG